MTEAAVELLASRKPKAVGADTIACETPIVDGVPGGNPGHMKHWLPNGILILECVANLERLPNRVFFAALPLPIANGSGSPLRPIALF
jgi:kynurenine formamidase